MKKAEILKLISEQIFDYQSGILSFEGVIADRIYCDITYSSDREFNFFLWDDLKDLSVDIDYVFTRELKNVLSGLKAEKLNEDFDDYADHLESEEMKQTINKFLYE